MADQHNANIPNVANVIANDLEDIKENLEFHKDAFQNICGNWSDTVATQIFPTKWNRTALSSNTTEAISHNIVEFDCSGGARTYTLRAAATVGDKRYLFVKLVDATNALTIDGDGSETIDGATTITLDTLYETVCLYCDGSNWKCLHRYNPAIDIANNTYIKAVDVAGTGTIDVIKVDTDDKIVIGEGVKYMQLAETTAPGTAANEGAIYCKEFFGTTHLFFQGESSGSEYQLTGPDDNSYPRDYLAGFALSIGGDTEHDVDIATGACRDSTDAVNIELSSGVTRQIDAEFGTGNGGMYVGGSVAVSTTYYIIAIKKDSDGTANIYFDTSATAANIPAGHTYYKTIGRVISDASSNIGADLGSIKSYVPMSKAYGVQMYCSYYTGDGNDSRNIDIGIDLLNAAQKWVSIKDQAGNAAVQRFGNETGDVSDFFGASAQAANYVQAWTTNGFQVGSNNDVNDNGHIYNYVVFWQEL